MKNMIIGEKAKYYVMGCEASPGTAISNRPDISSTCIPGETWSQEDIDQINQLCPLKLTIDVDYEGDIQPYYYAGYDYMREDLIESIKGSGFAVNLQVFPAEITNPWTKEVYKNYKLVNIVGLVSCEGYKTQKTKIDEPLVEGDTTGIMTESLYIDEEKATKAGLDMFRLKENPTTIIVSDRVRESIERSGVPYMVFYGPGVWGA